MHMTGPDAQDTIECDLEQLHLAFCASELRLRGDETITQPHTDAQGNILCWNGEVKLDRGPLFVSELTDPYRCLRVWTSVCTGA